MVSTQQEIRKTILCFMCVFVTCGLCSAQTIKKLAKTALKAKVVKEVAKALA